MSQFYVNSSGGGSGGPIDTITGNDGIPESPVGNNFNIVTANSTVKFTGSTATETLDFNNVPSLNLVLGSSLPARTTGFSNVGVGALTLNTVTTGEGNTTLGADCAQSVTTGSTNTLIGVTTGLSLDVGIANTAIGAASLLALTSGTQNTSLGTASLESLSIGSHNISVGANSSSNYTTSESSNIIIANSGTAAESNTLRIGTQGSGTAQVNRAFIAGIAGVTVSNQELVTLNSSTGQLGVTAANGFIAGNGSTVTSFVPLWYGDGSDGSQTFDGSTTILGLVPSGSAYTLNRDLVLASSTINNGVSIITNGYRIFCNGTLTNNGTIQWDGANGTTGGNGGAAQVAGSVANGTSGGNGATGTGGGGGPQGSNAIGGAGGNGGAGASPGGSGGTIAAPNAAFGSYRIFSVLTTGSFIDAADPLFPGAGGGGGGGDATNKGGGGGAGGGFILICAYLFAGTGSIHANGGNAGNGAVGGTNCGGGGGGGGGVIFIVSASASAGAITGQTISVAGGTHGTATGTGVNGTDGAVGLKIVVAA
jgi:hypothetical protein